MNIFFLSINPKKCVKYYFNKHVVKMILEHVQMLSTAWHVLEPEEAEELYQKGLICKKSHMNHPCNIWVRNHINNYKFLVLLTIELMKEWNFRYGHEKTHATQEKLDFLKDNFPPSISMYKIKKTSSNPYGFTLPMFQAMPDDCKYKPDKESVGACIKAYRRLYMSEHKEHIVEWYHKRPNLENGEKTDETKSDSTLVRKDISPPWWWGEEYNE